MNCLIRFLPLVLLVLPTGCVSVVEKFYPSDALPEEWRPLEKIQERPEMLAKDTVSTTIGRTLYVANLAKWFEKHPPGSVRWRAILRHEQEHSRRQLAAGVLLWMAKYAYDIDFMWNEEMIGYYYAITIRQQGGDPINPLGLANTLHGYKNLSGNMVSFDDALTWINQVLAGQWQPPPSPPQ